MLELLQLAENMVHQQQADNNLFNAFITLT